MKYAKPDLFSVGPAATLIQQNNGEKANPPHDSLDSRNSCFIDEADD